VGGGRWAAGPAVAAGGVAAGKMRMWMWQKQKDCQESSELFLSLGSLLGF